MEEALGRLFSWLSVCQTVCVPSGLGQGGERLQEHCFGVLHGSGGIQPSPAPGSCCHHLMMTSMEEASLLAPQVPIRVCPIKFLPLLGKRCSRHHFRLPCQGQASISPSVSHWYLAKPCHFKLVQTLWRIWGSPAAICVFSFLQGCLYKNCLLVKQVLGKPVFVIPDLCVRNPPWLHEETIAEPFPIE